jgi:hypothetical protein
MILLSCKVTTKSFLCNLLFCSFGGEIVRDRDIEREKTTTMDRTEETNPAPKRTWFDVTPTSGTGAAQTLKVMAAFTIKQYIVTLQPNITTITKKLGLQHIGLQARVFNKNFQVGKMEDDADFIPRLAQTEFSLKVSKKTEKPKRRKS